ncbi:MAG: molecular chaperone DnaK [Hoeflea sp.]|nr:molecular chaperone DnaK [Hoeflea sp.]
MNLGNSAFDLAELRAEQEREAAIRAAGLAVSRPGSPDCVECGDPIGNERRAAAPFATRCVSCAERQERNRRA